MTTPDDYEFYLEEPMPEREFYQWIGRCIKEWVRAETALFDICHRILSVTRKHAAIIYYRTPTLETRIALVNELLLTELPQHERKGGHDHPDVAIWKRIIADIRALLPLRNILAHSRVGRVRSRASFATAEGDFDDLETTWWEIATHWEEELRGKQELSILDRQLPAHFKEVESVLSRLEQFTSVLRKKYLKREPPEESAPYRFPPRSYRKARSTPSRQAKPKRPPGSSRA